MNGVDEPYPAAKGREFGRAVVKAGLSAVPLVGGPAAELLDVVIRPAIRGREERWLNALAEAVTEAKERGVDMDALVDDERFVTATIEASRIALGTHLEEKLRMLKACIVHMAMPDRPDDFLAMRFLRFVDELTPEHFHVLTYARDPSGWYESHGIPKTDYMTAPRVVAMEGAGLRVSGTELQMVLGDLTSRGLMMQGSTGMVSGPSVYDPLNTGLGSQLLDFVVLMVEDEST